MSRPVRSGEPRGAGRLAPSERHPRAGDLRNILRRALRYNGAAVAAMVGVALLGSAVGGYILSNQRLNPPAWVPVIGEDPFELRVQLTSAQGVLPGQGQAVNVSGVKVGDIASVGLVDGNAVIEITIEQRFARVYPDATALLRPKTGLKDMVLELDPGSPSSGERLEEGALIDTGETMPDANLDEFLGSLDEESQSYLQLLVGGGGRALGDGGGRDLANTFRRFAPLARDGARATRLVASRRAKLRRLMGNLSLLARELGARDDELARFVSGSAGVFERFAAQNERLAETVELLPPALRSSNRALAKFDRLGGTLEDSFGELRPTARALAPGLQRLQPFFSETVPTLREDIRPFARAAQPTTRALRPAARDFGLATGDLGRVTTVLNALVDELAYDPPGKGKGDESYLFYAPWAAHNTNSTLSDQDGIGPIRRGLVMISCGQLQLLESLAEPKRNPTLSTFIQLLSLPVRSEVCPRAEGDPPAEVPPGAPAPAPGAEPAPAEPAPPAAAGSATAPPAAGNAPAPLAPPEEPAP